MLYDSNVDRAMFHVIFGGTQSKTFMPAGERLIASRIGNVRAEHCLGRDSLWSTFIQERKSSCFVVALLVNFFIRWMSRVLSP